MFKTNGRGAKAAWIAGVTTLMLAAAAAVGVVPSAAQDPPAPIAAEALTARSVFTDEIHMKLRLKEDQGETAVVQVDDPSRTVVVRYTVQPGAQFPWHSHAGPVFVNLISGELTYIEADTCVETRYTSGQAFVDPGQGHVHSAINRGATPTVFIATFYAAPAEGGLLIPAEPGDC
ncbi:MAG TPA: cupin domain-containing protein [Gaiella sp.]|jgi:quercetin dioxygenase-like cupin family protein|nr:cupin domain-containing protein [Gaiella sp.]